MKRIAVYCGSRMPENKNILDEAKALGKLFAQYDIALVYGGAKIGLMGIIADEVKTHGGRIIGVMPDVLVELEILRDDLDEVYLTDTMHTRKAKMMELADAFVALPGGCGTMEEIFEVITWNQIGIHHKPYAFLNIDHYYDGIKDYLDHALAQNLTSQENYERVLFIPDSSSLLKALQEKKV